MCTPFIVNIEYIILFIILVIGIVPGLKRKNQGDVVGNRGNRLLVVDKNMSTAIKGIGCIFILMGHFVKLNSQTLLNTTFTTAIYLTTANIALTWFMFLSGYGLSIKDNNNLSMKGEWNKRIKKIYTPLLFTCVCAMMTYAILPDKFSLTECMERRIPQDIHLLKNIGMLDFGGGKMLFMHTLGLFDWYVFCILIFYSLFYFSVFLSKKYKRNQTILLSILLLIYYVLAYYSLGMERAHWFRYPWAFMLGHLVAVGNRNNRWTKIIISFVFLLSVLLLREKIMIFCYIIAITSLAIASIINRKYIVIGRPILFLGGISYFFYLCHVRLGWILMRYTPCNSLLFWIIITILISFLLKVGYKYFLSIK